MNNKLKLLQYFKEQTQQSRQKFHVHRKLISPSNWCRLYLGGLRLGDRRSLYGRRSLELRSSFFAELRSSFSFSSLSSLAGGTYSGHGRWSTSRLLLSRSIRRVSTCSF